MNVFPAVSDTTGFYNSLTFFVNDINNTNNSEGDVIKYYEDGFKIIDKCNE